MKRFLFVLFVLLVPSLVSASTINLAPGEVLCETGPRPTPPGMTCDTVVSDFGQTASDMVVASDDFTIGGFVKRRNNSLYADVFNLILPEDTGLTLEIFNWNDPFDADVLLWSAMSGTIVNTVISSASPFLTLGTGLAAGWYTVVLDAAGGNDANGATTNWRLVGSVDEPELWLTLVAGLVPLVSFGHRRETTPLQKVAV